MRRDEWLLMFATMGIVMAGGVVIWALFDLVKEVVHMVDFAMGG